MSTYTCEKCNRIFYTKCNYEHHLYKRKTRCDRRVNANLHKELADNISADGKIKNVLNDGEIIKMNDKYKCPTCDETFDSADLLDKHSKLICQANINHNNIYKFDTKTFGKNMFSESKSSGDIYIIQNDFYLDDIYKIGITTNLYNRVAQYRCGNAYEPRIHYYFPCKDIKEADKILKHNLRKYHIKREIYKGDIDEIKNVIETSINKINNGIVIICQPDIKKKDIFECGYCKKIYVTKQDLFTHYKKCTEYFKTLVVVIENEKICIYNKEQFTRLENLTTHQQTELMHEIIKQILKEKQTTNLIDEILEQILKKKHIGLIDDEIFKEEQINNLVDEIFEQFQLAK